MRQGRYLDYEITALGHDGFIVENIDKKISFAFDPYDILEPHPVDYIFVSHAHFDHCDVPSIKKLSSPKTKVIAPISCQRELAELGNAVIYVEDKDKHEVGPIIYWAIAAYNINKYRTPNEVFHPKEAGGVGFVVEIDRIRFYHAGDTDQTPEMEALKKLDVAFLPISGTFVMTLDEALKAAELLNPKLVIPMHFGKLLGSSAEAVRYQNLLNGKVPVKVLTTTDA